MADAAYTARATARDQIESELATVKLANDGGAFTHEALQCYIDEVGRVLMGVYNADNPTNGVYDLLVDGSSLSRITTRHHYNADKILKLREKEGEKLNAKGVAMKNDGFVVDIPRPEATEEADRKNYAVQSVLGAKEGLARAFAKTFGSHITDPILRDPKGVPRNVDDYTIVALIDAARNNANRPTPRSVLDLVVEIVNYTFDFRQKVTANVEALRTKINNVRGLGISIDATQQAFVIIANIEAAAQADWGRDFRNVLDDIRKEYAYNHVHDAASITNILRIAATADSVRSLRDAPAPDLSSANSVAESVSYLNALLANPEEYDTADEEDVAVGTAHAAASDSESSYEERPRRRRTGRGRGNDRDKKKSSSRRSRSSRRRPERQEDDSDDERRERNKNCKHCKKYGRTRKHPNISPSRCNWNLKYKGYRPRDVCDQLGIKFKARTEFPPELGGFPKSTSDSKNSE